VDAKRLRQWIAELDDDAFGVREAATTRLADHLEAAAGLLEEARQNTSAEVRLRAERLRGRKAAGESVRLRRAGRCSSTQARRRRNAVWNG
jgi:hypothetical protein